MELLILLIFVLTYYLTIIDSANAKLWAIIAFVVTLIIAISGGVLTVRKL